MLELFKFYGMSKEIFVRIFQTSYEFLESELAEYESPLIEFTLDLVKIAYRQQF